MNCPFRERPIVRYLARVRPTLISCPTCGRCQVDLGDVVRDVERVIMALNTPARVAVMGCAVNGPGEASDADIGVACGKGQAILFQKGKKVMAIPTSRIGAELLERLPHIIVDDPKAEPVRWLCWADMSSQCRVAPEEAPCWGLGARENYRQSCPHRT